jgi:uncharacterized protein with von Willebrand factor type A (vWA) domain
MIAGLGRFVVELRRAGLGVSPAEWIEAMRAVELLGIDRRERLRLALRCTLAKRAHHQAIFDEAFDRFFVSPGRPGRRKPSRKPRRTAAAGVRRMFDRAADGTFRRSGRLRHAVLARESEQDREERRERRMPSPSPADSLRRDLRRRLDAAAEREIAEQIPRIVEQLRLRTGRRHRRSTHGQLYLRKVFRENVTWAGVPFVLPRRRRRGRRSRVVLLIDVSWSTARAAGLFLTLACDFLERARDTRVLFFVDRAVDATVEVRNWLAREATPSQHGPPPAGRRRHGPGDGIVRGGVSFARLVESLRGLNLEAPSDYGRAFHALARSSGRPSGRKTLFVVLGDGRTNRFDPQAWAFEEIADKCGAVVWLVPEQASLWETGDSALGAYLPHADVAVEASDLVGLARGVRELVRHL